MKKLLILLAVVIIFALAVFTGTWVFDILSWIFKFFIRILSGCATGLNWLANIFNFFGWNKGIL